MTTALSKAFADSQRSLIAAKAAVSSQATALMANGPSGLPMHRPDLVNSVEQLRHFRGWVYAAIRPIAQRIAGQPIHVGRKTSRRVGSKAAAGDVKPIDNHAILDLLADPNDLMVSWSLMFVTIASLELTGRQLWWLPKRESIMPIPTSWLRGFEGTTSITAFKVQPPHTGEIFNIPADECVYFSYPNPADPHGVTSPLQAVAHAVDADEAIQDSQASMFRQGIHPSHVVLVGKEPDGPRPRLSAAQQRQVIEAIKRRYSGVHRHGEPLILDGLIEDVKKLSHSPAEMDWLNSSEQTKQRILQGFGVNEVIIGSKESNRASAFAADRHFCQYTLNPKIELLSQTLTEWLRPQFGDDLVVWIEPAVANDDEQDLKWITLLAKHSAITGDEMRELSPFDLPIGEFGKPVAGAGDDPEAEAEAKLLGDAMKMLAEPLVIDHRHVDPQVDRILARL